MEREGVEAGPMHWFIAALFRVAGLHAAAILVIQLAQSGAAFFLFESIGAMIGLALLMAIIGAVFFAVFGGLTHWLLGAFGLRVWWSYLLAGLLIGAGLGEFIASIGMLVPNATGPHPYDAGTHRLIVSGLAGWSGLNALIGWWSWRQREQAG